MSNELCDRYFIFGAKSHKNRVNILLMIMIIGRKSFIVRFDATKNLNDPETKLNLMNEMTFSA